MFEADSLRQALSTLGVLLADRGLTFEIVAVGGGGLLLLGVIQRPTNDLDVLALVEGGEYLLARPLPKGLREAVEDSARVLNLANDWLNSGPTDRLKQGLPPGFRDRTTRHEFGGIIVHLAGRYDQICFKLYAAADSAPGSKHVNDLIELDPNSDEMRGAVAWVKQQDVGEEFASFVDSVVEHVKATRASR